MAGQMYVEYQVPKNVRHPYPVVMIHGAGQTGTNFLSTPDDRPGWAQFFVANGYAVYVVDQTGRGRSVYTTELYGPTRPPFDVEGRVRNWSAQQEFKLYPKAELHTQWPGTGKPGGPFFDQFYASQVQLMVDPIKTQGYAQKALSALLDKIGPAILLTHSQSGTFGFLAADKRPDLVKAVITVEGGGTPRGFTAVGPPKWFEDAPPPDVTWGIAAIPITYSPAVTDPKQLHFVQESAPAPGKIVRCWVQAASARQLPNLKRMPQLLVVGEASAASDTNHCVSRYLTQAGVENTWVNLGDVGIHGNGHMMMLEKNQLEIAAFLASWLKVNVEQGAKETR
jgi:pimeloyl-ACP methyl ester carboxylesterase